MVFRAITLSSSQEAELVFGFDEGASFQESALPLFPDDTPGVYSIAFVGEQGRLSTDIREFQQELAHLFGR